MVLLMQEPSLDDSKNFSILQPGSSVATALSEGESRRKHIVLLEVVGEQWRTVKVALRTVRPFLFESVRPRTFLPAPNTEGPLWLPSCAMPSSRGGREHGLLSKAACAEGLRACTLLDIVVVLLMVVSLLLLKDLWHLRKLVGTEPGRIAIVGLKDGSAKIFAVQIVLADQKGLNPEEPEVRTADVAWAAMHDSTACNERKSLYMPVTSAHSEVCTQQWKTLLSGQ